MTTTEGLRYIDSDGHILEHPTAMPDYAPAEYRDRIWHIETDEDGVEWLHYNGTVMPSNGLSLAGTAGFPDEEVDARPQRQHAVHRGATGGVQRQGAPPGHGHRRHRPRGAVPDVDARPAELPDVDFARVQARAYNDWASDHTQEGEGRLFGAGAVPPMNDEDGVQARRRRDPPRRRAAGHGVGVHAPEPVGRLAAVQRPGLRPDLAGARPTPGSPIAFHPFLMPDLPGACRGLQLASARSRTGATRPSTRASPPTGWDAEQHPLHAGDRQPGRRDELDLLHHRRRRVRALPGHEVHVPRGQRRLAGAVARAPRPPLRRSSSGTCRG